MKKTILLLLAVVMFLFSACEKKPPETDAESTDPSTTTKESTTLAQKIEHIADKLKNGMLENLEDYNEEEKEQIKQAVENDGYTLEFNEDGSGTLSSEEGEWTVAAGWVRNDYTDGVPEVDFANITMSMEDSDNRGNYYMFLIRQANYLEVENYVETLEGSGFDKVISKAMYQEGNTAVFEAENSEGKRVELGYSSLGFTFKIYK